MSTFDLYEYITMLNIFEDIQDITCCAIVMIPKVGRVFLLHTTKCELNKDHKVTDEKSN